jgi:hypothetical protein
VKKPHFLAKDPEVRKENLQEILNLYRTGQRVPRIISALFGGPCFIRVQLDFLRFEPIFQRIKEQEDRKARQQKFRDREKQALATLQSEIEAEENKLSRSLWRAGNTVALRNARREIKERVIAQALVSKSAAKRKAGEKLKTRLNQ